MNFTELTIRLLLLFFPGIICHFIVDLLTVHRERKPHEVVLLSFVYGVASYSLYAFALSVLGVQSIERGILIPSPDLTFLKALTDANEILDFSEIAFVTLISFALGFFLSTAKTHKWLHRTAQKWKVTQKFGDHDVWTFAFNSPEVEWAVVRDAESNFMYFGYVRAFSDVEDVAQILLQNVIVYNESTGEELYRADRMLIARPRDSLVIELPSSH